MPTPSERSLNWITPVCRAVSSSLITRMRLMESLSAMACWVMFSK